ncbi:hypothetical protein [Bizionia paragorgiae]|uniref:hypothetical protein n=1 Tax=Bizionia paragorgiae TaxID=283786 RepID=UPI00299DDB13|nr:hypothetical protein [Bizionia paragorgiae]MDX1272266.1 hypothetical protein [Bizionia paragorgiae]
MTATLISLISIVFGIIGANSFAALNKKYSFGLIGNTIAGVFGSILFIKSFGRLGFNPQAIVSEHSVSISLFILNCTVSLIAGGLALRLLHYLKSKVK